MSIAEKYINQALRDGLAPMARSIASNRLRESETLECNEDARREFLLKLAEEAAGDLECRAFAARCVLVAFYSAGYDVDLFRFGQLVGVLMTRRLGIPTIDASLDILLDSIFNFSEETTDE